METKHTKGSWHAHDGQIYPEETGITIALIPYFDKQNEEHLANQKIIEAAPEMLEALILFSKTPCDVDWMGENIELIKKVKSVIQKATS